MHQIDKKMLAGRLERSLLTVVSSVGVDIVAAGQYAHVGALLPFVPGLGLRKAKRIRQLLSQKA